MQGPTQCAHNTYDNHHWWVEEYLWSARCVGPLHTRRLTYEYGSYVLCVVLGPAHVQIDLWIWVVCVMCCVGPCIRAGRPINMGRMCYVLCWPLHTCRSTYEYGSYVLCWPLHTCRSTYEYGSYVLCVWGPCCKSQGWPMNMGRMCYVFEAPAVSRRVDLWMVVCVMCLRPLL